MLVRRGVPCLTLSGALLLSVAGCGGAPSTGEQVNSKPDDEAKKKMLDGYLKTMVQPKGKPKPK
jgi:hypothetical protein